MDRLRQAILGTGNRSTTIMGVCAIVSAIALWISSGEMDTKTVIESIALIATGLGLSFARGGGTGSDTPPTA